MKTLPLRFWLVDKSILLWFCLLTSNPAAAQIIPDATLPNNSVIIPQGNTTVIEGGTKSGGNLFHSFQQFSVPTGTEVFFNNALDIQNILSRVTGISVSNIDGLIRANGSANLFLINPNGIIFGPNARLNIGGSFLASTANSLKFADGTSFSATPAESTPLLTVSVPIGLQYKGKTGEIRVQGKVQDAIGVTQENLDNSFLGVNSGKILSLVGGNVIVDGGILQAAGGRIELGGLAGEGTVEINADSSLRFPDGVERADVSITHQAEINVLAGGGGSIAIAARNLEISGDSLLSAGIATNLGSMDSMAGDITLSATEALKIAASQIANTVNPNATGNSGNINIETGALSVTDGAILGASTFGEGKAGNVNIVARDTVSFVGEKSAAGSTVEATGKGEGGDINITTGSLSVADGAILSASVFGEGKAGDVNIVARNTVSFANRSAAATTVEATGKGEGGDINITTPSLFVTGGAALTASTQGQGRAGNVTIVANDIVSFADNGNATSTVAENGVGEGGNINITTGSLFVTGGAVLGTSSFGEGKAGNVTIVARNHVSFAGEKSAVASTVEENALGEGGDINITADSVSLTNGAELTASNLGMGKAAGNITVQADSIRLDNQARIRADTNGGEGNIVLRSRPSDGEAPSITLSRGSSISTNATGGTSGGNIDLQASALILRQNSQIATNAQGNEVEGGNITLDTDVIAALENSDISANSENFFGGQIQITAQGIFGTEFRDQPTPDSDITASSKAGAQFSGTVTINTPDVDPSSGLVQLPETIVDAENQIAQRCTATGVNQLTVTGRGGLPPNPSEALSDRAVWLDFVTPTGRQQRRKVETGALRTQHETLSREIVEAQGWVTNAKGEIVLTAAVPTVTARSPNLGVPHCQAFHP